MHYLPTACYNFSLKIQTFPQLSVLEHTLSVLPLTLMGNQDILLYVHPLHLKGKLLFHGGHLN